MLGVRMRISEIEKNEIISVTQQTFKSRPGADIKFNSYTLEQLRQVDEMIGNRDIDAGYRIRIRNRIKELEEALQLSLQRAERKEDKQEQRSYEKGVRIWKLVTGFFIGVVVTIVGQWLFRLASGSI